MSHSSRSTTPEEEDVVLPDALASLSQRIDNGPEVLALGNKEMQLAALQAAKYVFDLGMFCFACIYSESNARSLSSAIGIEVTRCHSRAARDIGSDHGPSDSVAGGER